MAHPSADNPTFWHQQQQKLIHHHGTRPQPVFAYESSQWALQHPQVVMLRDYYCTPNAAGEPTSVLDHHSSPSLESSQSPISSGDPNSMFQQQQVSPDGILLGYDQHWPEEARLGDFKLEADANDELLFPSSSSCCSSKRTLLNAAGTMGSEWIDSFMKELESDTLPPPSTCFESSESSQSTHAGIALGSNGDEWGEDFAASFCIEDSLLPARNQPYPWTPENVDEILAYDIPSVSSSPPAQLLPSSQLQQASQFRLSAQDSARLRLERGAASVEFLELFLETMHRTAGDPNGDVDALVKRLEAMSSHTGDPEQRVGFYFTQALINSRLRGRRLHGQDHEQANAIAHRALNEACPYVKFAHLSANQAILEATAGARRVHVIDYGTGMHGVQWAALLQAYAAVSTDSSPPPRLRITSVAPNPRSVQLLDPIGRQLGEFAKLLQIEFEFCVVVGIEELHGLCDEQGEEVVAVNFMMQLRNLLKEAPERVNRHQNQHQNLFEEKEAAGYGGRGNGELLGNILCSVKRLRPQVLTVAEYDTGFKRSVGYSGGLVDTFLLYCAVFESLDSSPYGESDSTKRLHVARLERAMFSREIDGVVAGRLERAEWKRALLEAGFRAVPPSNYAVSQARLLLWLYCEGFKLADDHQKECLTLGWKDRPVITVSSWQGC